MKLPKALAALDKVQLREARSDRLLLDIDGNRAWYGCYPHGVCLAIDTTLRHVDSAWLHQICLWFASMRAALNDSLLLEAGQLYLLRRYESTLDSVQWEAAIGQQLALVDWLTRQSEQATSCHP